MLGRGAPIRAGPSQKTAIRRLIRRVPQAVLFDWDDTLADERKTVRLAHEELFRRFKLKRPPHKVLEDQWRDDHAVFYERFFPGIAVEDVETVWHDITETIRRGDKVGGKRLAPASLYPGAVEILKELRRLGVTLAVVSNKREATLYQANDATGVRSFFKIIYGHKEGRERKPSPQSINETLKALGVLAENAWYVGDQVSDAQASRGLSRILIGRRTRTLAQARGAELDPEGEIVYIDSLKKLLGIVKRLK